MWYIGSDTGGTYYIAHHGILGQKWGIRRYQNKDGTLTDEGKRHAVRGKQEIDKIVQKGENKARNVRIRGRIAGGAIDAGLTTAGLAAGLAVASSGLPPLAAIKTEAALASAASAIGAGASAGGISGKIGGGTLKSVINENANTKAQKLIRQYAELGRKMQNFYDYDMKRGNFNQNEFDPVYRKAFSKKANNRMSKISGNKTQRFTKKELDALVINARGTKKYPKEFIDSNNIKVDKFGQPIVIDDSIDRSYRKWLKDTYE